MITVQHVSKYYGAHAAVRDLDFKIDEGECVGFLGLNGAGKTTTLRMLSCLLLPTSGRVTVRGIDAEEDPHEIRKFIGFLPDTPPLYDEMTVLDFLAFAGRIRQMDADHLQRRIDEVIELCGLRSVAEDLIQSLSHGFRQRVGIAQAIIHEPALLILDEPIQGLDPVQIVEMREMIRRLRGKHTILLSSHILSEIEQTCDRILMLHEGQIAAQGSEAELANQFGAGVTVEVSVRGEAPAIETLLRAVEGVADLRHVGDDGGVHRFRFTSDTDPREAVAAKVVQGGLGLRSLERVSTGLERMFVSLSRRDSTGGVS